MDKPLVVCNAQLEVSRFEAEVLVATDYYPFGMIMPGRDWTYQECTEGFYDTTYGYNQLSFSFTVQTLTTGQDVQFAFNDEAPIPTAIPTLTYYQSGHTLQEYIDEIVANGTAIAGLTFTQTATNEVTFTIDAGSHWLDCGDTFYVIKTGAFTTFYATCSEQVKWVQDCKDVGYRYGFNGMEKDNEVKGSGNSLDFGARIYDSRLGRFYAVDAFYADNSGLSPFTYANNNPLYYLDNDGNDWIGFNTLTLRTTCTFNSSDGYAGFEGSVLNVPTKTHTEYFALSPTFSKVRKDFEKGGRFDLLGMDISFQTADPEHFQGGESTHGGTDLMFTLNDESVVDARKYSGDGTDIKRAEIKVSLNANENMDMQVDNISHEVSIHGVAIGNLWEQYKSNDITFEQFQAGYKKMAAEGSSVSSLQHKDVTSSNSLYTKINKEILGGIAKSYETLNTKNSPPVVSKTIVSSGVLKHVYYSFHLRLLHTFKNQVKSYGGTADEYEKKIEGTRTDDYGEIAEPAK